MGQHVPTEERGDPNFRRKTDIDGNKVRTSVFNFGLTGRTGANPGEIPYEWPINSGKHYIALTALFVGSEVKTEAGDIKPFVTVPLGRNDNQGNSMMFEPVPGYLNPNSNLIAKSDEPDTWPLVWPDKMEDEKDPGWPESWNGFFGKNKFNADQEIFFKISDDRNFMKGNVYIPDTTDISRGGMGILSGIRVMEWSQVLVEDVVFILYEIKNDGTKDLDKVSFALWLADLVGGDGDSGDDTPDFDLLYDIAWSMDMDGIGNSAFGTDRVGVAATAYLETPGNNVDRIDNDGDGEHLGEEVTEDFLIGEVVGNAKDDNYNGLIDENKAHLSFGGRPGVSFVDGIDDNGNGEKNSPVVTLEMIDAAQNDVAPTGQSWKRWPPNPESDPVQNKQIHLIHIEQNDEGKIFADGIDNNESEEYPFGFGADTSGPRITQAIIDTASLDPFKRYRVPGQNIILYDVGDEDLGMRYADGIDNDGDGAIDEGIDEGIDEMIDESRDDNIDNDFDWNPLMDDVGLDGLEESTDLGERDGRPTSGTGTNLPGERNIDKTDVSESDQMGLTGVQYDEAGTIPTAQDLSLWGYYMVPGELWQPPPEGQPPGDYDLFVNSGFFPIKAGHTERVSMAVSLGENVEDARRNKDVAQKTYDEDYQFAKAPIPPRLKAVPGDNKVTLIWDDIAESSFDTYMYGIGSEGFDFEGYKIYKATDPEFGDAYDITDAKGNLTFYTPIAQFDKLDGIKGYHEVAVNGVHYWQGDDTGLLHTFIDEDVINGQTYYYTVVSYDFGGDLSNQIPPTESTKRLTINSLTGAIRKGSNVAVVTPNPPAAGFQPAKFDTLQLVQGTTSGTITYRILDPLVIKNNHRYQITFEDTLIPKKGNFYSPGYDTITTKSFTLSDITNPSSPDTLIDKSRTFYIKDEQPIIDGFQLQLDNFRGISPSESKSSWSRDKVWRFVVDRFALGLERGTPVPADYRIIITSTKDYVSTAYHTTTLNFKKTNVNFYVEKHVKLTGIDSIDWEPIPFAFGDFSKKNGSGTLNADNSETDWVIFLDYENGGTPSPSWLFKLRYPSSKETVYTLAPQPGDTAFVIINKPFLSTDIFVFHTRAPSSNSTKIGSDMEKIKVVPNPYISAAPWEPRNMFTSGRGPRSIHFNHLPNVCTIRIFTISGELVKTIYHKSPVTDGTAEWDLLTKENLSASYGVYVYHVEAIDPQNGQMIGEHIGKFAIIK